MSRKQTIKLAAAFGFGLLILFYLFWSMGFENITRLFMKVKPEYFLYAAGVYFVSEVLGAFALKTALKSKLGLRRILPSHMCGMLYSAVTPGRVGYYYTAFAIAKKTKESRTKNIGLLTLMQGIGFFAKVVSCLIAVVYLSARFINQASRDYLLMASLVPIVFVIIIALILYTKAVNRALKHVPSMQWALKHVTDLQHAGKDVSGGIIFQLLLINFAGWFLVGLQWFFLAQSLSLDISYWDAFMIQPLLSAVMFVPFTPSGLGITEGGSALLFALMMPQIPTTDAKAAGVAFVLLTRINSIAVDALGLIDMRIHARSEK
jgi:uncharacterized protein (TIRG00374 family)